MIFGPTKVVLRNERTGSDRRSLSARLDPRGDLIVEGHDLGEGVNSLLGYDEYEWTWTVLSQDVPALMNSLGVRRGLLSALKKRFSGSAAAQLEPFLETHQIPHQFWSRIGD